MKYNKYSFFMLIIGLLYNSTDCIKSASNEKVHDAQVEDIELKWLSSDEKIELFQELLQDVVTLDLNVPLVVLNLSQIDEIGIKWFVDELKKLAEIDSDSVVTMNHAEILFDKINGISSLEDLPEDLQADLITSSPKMRQVALHEAGHAVATLCGDAHNFLYIKNMFMKSVPSKNGHIIGANLFLLLRENESGLDEDELKAFLQVDVGGLAGEVVFKDVIGNQTPELDGNDADQAGFNMDRIIRKRSNGIYGALDKSEEGQSLLLEAFNKTVLLLELHKEKVENLALQLLKKKTLQSDEIYEICEVEKPKLEIQRRSFAFDSKKKNN